MGPTGPPPMGAHSVYRRKVGRSTRSAGTGGQRGQAGPIIWAEGRRGRPARAGGAARREGGVRCKARTSAVFVLFGFRILFLICWINFGKCPLT